MSMSEQTVNFSVALDLAPVYTAAHILCGIPLVTRGVLSDITVRRNAVLSTRLSLSTQRGEIYTGTYETVLPFPTHYDGQRIRLPIRFPADAFDCGKALSSVSEKTDLRIRLSVTFDGSTAVFSRDIRFLPYGFVCAEMPPELLGTYVLPGADFAQALCSRAQAAIREAEGLTLGAPSDNAVRYASALYSVLKAEGFSHDASRREVTEGECTVRDMSEILSAKSRTLGKTETALLFASCAERMGLSVWIAFLRKGAGAQSVLIGIDIGDGVPTVTVSESISYLRARCRDGKTVFFNIDNLLDGGSADFSYSCSEAEKLLFKSSSSLTSAVSIASARLLGVLSLRPHGSAGLSESPVHYSAFDNVKDALGEIEAAESACCLDSFSPTAEDHLGIVSGINLPSFGENYLLSPMDDDSLRLSPDIVGEFTAFSSVPKQVRNNSDKERYSGHVTALQAKFKDLREKNVLTVYPSAYLLLCEKPDTVRIRDEFIHSAKALSEENGRLYAAFGIVRKKEKKASEAYAPCCFVPCEILEKDGQFLLRFGTGDVLPNRVLLSEICRKEGKNCASVQKPEDPVSVLEAFRKAADGSDVFTVTGEIFLCRFDLWPLSAKACVERADGRKFESFLESGKYEGSDKKDGTQESLCCPFDRTSVMKSFLSAAFRDSVILSAPGGCGRNESAANLVCSEVFAGRNVLGASEYADSLSGIEACLDTAGLSELYLDVSEKKGLCRKIEADLEAVSAEPDFPDSAFGGSESAEEALDEYADEIFSEYGFGLSLADVSEKYALCDRSCGGKKNIGLTLSACDLPSEEYGELLECASELAGKAASLSSELAGETPVRFSFDKIHALTLPASGFDEILKNASESLRQFTERSAFSREVLGITDRVLGGVQSFCAFGEFLQLVVSSRVDYIPDGIFSGSTVKNAECITELCGLLDRLYEAKQALGKYDELPSCSAFGVLYKKWHGAENNPFVRSSVMHELRELSFPDEKISPKETGGLLELLARREELRESIARRSAEASILLGALWKNEDTDTEKARAVAAFLSPADSLIKRIFRLAGKPAGFASRCARLMRTVFEDDAVRTDLVIAASAFDVLSRNSLSEGLLAEISDTLKCDLFEFSFDGGVLGEKGLASVLSEWRDRMAAMSKLCQYNRVKKKAIRMGLMPLAAFCEENGAGAETESLFLKSIFGALGKDILQSKSLLSHFDPEKARNEFKEAEALRKKTAVYRLLSLHRSNVNDFLASPDGKDELYRLRRLLGMKNPSVPELLRSCPGLMGALYPVLFALPDDAYTLPLSFDTLVLLDSGKTATPRALPLLCNTDKAILIGEPFPKNSSVMSALPTGMEKFEFSEIMPGSCGIAVRFISEKFPELNLSVPECAFRKYVRFEKCSGGMYDRGSYINKAEAICVCETVCREAVTVGVENVGVIAMTRAQKKEIETGLAILASKYRDEKLCGIPVRFIGDMAGLSKEHIVLSVTFGRNIYAVNRSFASFDRRTNSIFEFSPYLCELLNAKKQITVVSSVEPEEIFDDCLSGGASSVKELLCLAKYGCGYRDLASAGCPEPLYGEILGNLAGKHLGRCDHIGSGSDCALSNFDLSAVLSDTQFRRDAYDRVLLPEKLLSDAGYTVRYVPIADLFNE